MALRAFAKCHSCQFCFLWGDYWCQFCFLWGRLLVSGDYWCQFCFLCGRLLVSVLFSRENRTDTNNPPIILWKTELTPIILGRQGDGFSSLLFQVMVRHAAGLGAVGAIGVAAAFAVFQRRDLPSNS